VPVLSALARHYAVCDRWFASVPCQTWPNRAFVHAGTSCGRVNSLDKDVDDWTPPNPLYYNTPTIFNVLHDLGVSWKVYADSVVTPTLTRSQFITRLADPLLNGNFRGFSDFRNDAALAHLERRAARRGRARRGGAGARAP
jgi:phospholipase C